jgi:hypothetical protein
MNEDEIKEIFINLKIEELKEIRRVNKKWKEILSKKEFLIRILKTINIPEEFLQDTLKEYSFINVFKVIKKWYKESHIFIYSNINKLQFKTRVIWRLDLLKLNKSIIQARIPTLFSDYLYININCSNKTLKNTLINKIHKHEPDLKNFLQVEGIIEKEENQKSMKRNNKDLKTIKMDLLDYNEVEEIETIQNENKEQFHKYITNSQFYQDYKGKIVKWKNKIKKKGDNWISLDNRILITTTMSTDYFKEGDEIEYIGRLLSKSNISLFKICSIKKISKVR